MLIKLPETRYVKYTIENMQIDYVNDFNITSISKIISDAKGSMCFYIYTDCEYVIKYSTNNRDGNTIFHLDILVKRLEAVRKKIVRMCK